MQADERLWLCFLRGLNVFGRSQMPMFELEERCVRSFRELGLPLRFIDYYGPTGNVGVMASGLQKDVIREALVKAISKPCALLPPETLDELQEAFRLWAAPPDVEGFRWTRGVSLLCSGQLRDVEIVEPDLGTFRRVAAGVVAVYRKERITERGALDRDDRAGGWAAVSNHAETVCGGLWTARSLGVVQGLLGQLRRKPSTAGPDPLGSAT